MILHSVDLKTGSAVKSVEPFLSFFAPQKKSGEEFLRGELLQFKDLVNDEYFTDIVKSNKEKGKK